MYIYIYIKGSINKALESCEDRPFFCFQSTDCRTCVGFFVFLTKESASWGSIQLLGDAQKTQVRALKHEASRMKRLGERNALRKSSQAAVDQFQRESALPCD